MIRRALRIGQAAVLLMACVSAATAVAGTKKFLNEGVWRGEFTVDGEPIPFNFEVKGKDAAGAKFSLLNGARRDNFVVERIADDELSVPMNTYDAALVFKVVDGKHIQGEYRDLVPKRKRGAQPAVYRRVRQELAFRRARQTSGCGRRSERQVIAASGGRHATARQQQ